MKAIIFAAGLSSRLGALTQNKPKCCLEINDGQSLLSRSLEIILTQGVDELIIVAGHAHEKIAAELENWQGKFKSIEIVFNPHYHDRNNIYTAYLIKEQVNSQTLIFNSDIVYDAGILERAIDRMQNSDDSFMLIDDHKKLVDEDMKIYTTDGRITRINKDLDNEKGVGEYIGILRLNDEDAATFADSLTRMIEEEIYDKYYEDALDQAVGSLNLKILSTEGLSWAEIDTPEDYQRAQNLPCVKPIYQES